LQLEINSNKKGASHDENQFDRRLRGFVSNKWDRVGVGRVECVSVGGRSDSLVAIESVLHIAYPSLQLIVKASIHPSEMFILNRVQKMLDKVPILVLYLNIYSSKIGIY
jgi:hypothetical protein